MHGVVNVADRHVEGIIFRVSCHNGDSCLVTAKDDRDKNGTMVVDIGRKNVLIV
jgi:hypothetical protein